MESILLAVNTMSPVKNNPRLALEPVVYTPQETVPFSFTGVSQSSSFDTPTQRVETDRKFESGTDDLNGTPLEFINTIKKREAETLLRPDAKRQHLQRIKTTVQTLNGPRTCYNSVENLASVVKSHEQTVSETELTTSFGVPLAELLPEVFDHTLALGMGHQVTLEHILRVHGSSAPWLVTLINKLCLVEARLLTALLSQNMLQTENSMLKHQIRRTEKALEEANHETSQKEEKMKQLTKDNRSLLTTVNKLWQVLQRKMEMADSSVIYRENGVDIDGFETCTEEENLKH